jgi:uncharacterized protein YkwD
MPTNARRKALPVLIVAALALLLTGCFPNGAAEESAARVNAERTARGLPALVPSGTLIAKAQSWADRMAASGAARHSNLTEGAGNDWRVLGENVGAAGSIGEMHALFMASPGHRGSILDGRYNRFGIGVAEAGGRYYVVQVFAG